MMMLAAFLAAIANPALGFVTQNEITVYCRHFTLMMCTKSPPSDVSRPLGQYGEPIWSLLICGHNLFSFLQKDVSCGFVLPSKWIDVHGLLHLIDTHIDIITGTTKI
jgi:hypothetical protein